MNQNTRARKWAFFCTTERRNVSLEEIHEKKQTYTKQNTKSHSTTFTVYGHAKKQLIHHLLASHPMSREQPAPPPPVPNHPRPAPPSPSWSDLWADFHCKSRPHQTSPHSLCRHTLSAGPDSPRHTPSPWWYSAALPVDFSYIPPDASRPTPGPLSIESVHFSGRIAPVSQLARDAAAKCALVRPLWWGEGTVWWACPLAPLRRPVRRARLAVRPRPTGTVDSRRWNDVYR